MWTAIVVAAVDSKGLLPMDYQDQNQYYKYSQTTEHGDILMSADILGSVFNVTMLPESDRYKGRNYNI